MVSDRLIVTLLIVAILLSVFSIVMTMSLNVNKQLYKNPQTEGNNQANVQLTVVANPESGPSGSGGA
jgi:flagellar basal body-associated protein FliL